MSETKLARLVVRAAVEEISTLHIAKKPLRGQVYEASVPFGLQAKMLLRTVLITLNPKPACLQQPDGDSGVPERPREPPGRGLSAKCSSLKGLGPVCLGFRV